jgi:DNA polymerase III alpha subunit (gram-positive type)
MQVLVFDTETGGLNPLEDSVLSVGAVAGNLDTGEIIETFEAYHRLASLDDYHVSQGAIDVHGITPEKAFQDGLESEAIQDMFMDLWVKHNCSHIGGHNVPYDVEMMAYQVYDITPAEFRANFNYRMIDSSPMLRLLSGMDDVRTGQTLEQAVKAFKIDMSDYGKKNYHAALFDSICTFRVLCRFREVLGNPEIAKRLVVS